ncbi:MAG: tRNA pseudouridine(13) synthase TruD [Candidatus Thermoplasmatota archaeon]
MKAACEEKKIGIDTFLTDTPGIGGKIKIKTEDFIVKERPDFPKREKNGRYTIVEITEKAWETNQLVKSLSNETHISRKRIKFAGTKDKKAKTIRFFSFQDVEPEQIEKISLKNVEIKKIFSSNRPLRIGDLKGNYFEITIRKIDEKIKKEIVGETTESIKKNGGFPNYFGIQRFGKMRTNTHKVGRYLIQGNLKKAVMAYLGDPNDKEPEEIYKIREEIEKKHNFKQALKKLPNYLYFEKAILNKLAVNPEGYKQALEQLPKNLLTMFVYAYQSFLFNKIVSERIKKNIPLNKAVPGDIIHPIRKNKIKNKNIFVTSDNVDKVNIQIRKKKAVVTGLLLGTESVYAKGLMGEIEKKVINQENIKKRDFIIPEIPYLSSKGLRRPVIAFVKNLSYKIGKDELNRNKKKLGLKFGLDKGTYATSLLREYMKSTDISNY